MAEDDKAKKADAKKDATYEVRLLKSMWDENGDRIDPPETVNVPVKQAIKMVKEGKAEEIDE